jgi:chromosome segregation ATPase
MDEAYTLALRARATTLGVLNATKLVSNANDYSAKEISARQEDIDAILAHMRALDQGIGKFETEIQTEEQTVFAQIQELEIRFESMKRKLSTLISALGTVQRILDEEQSEHSALVQQQDQEAKHLIDTVAVLGPKIHGIISDISAKIKDAGIDYRSLSCFASV